MRNLNLTRVLTLSLLAIVGVLAVNASAASAAPWSLLRNSASVNLLQLSANLLAGELLVDGLGLEIYCSGGSATAHLEVQGGGATLHGKADAVFTGCIVLHFEKTCTVHSKGQPNGSILAFGEGNAESASPNVIALVESNEFTFIELLNALCPFLGVDAAVSGSATLTLLNALEDVKDHLAHLNEEELFFGEEIALIHGAGGPTTTPLAHVTEATGATWAIHLTP